MVRQLSTLLIGSLLLVACGSTPTATPTAAPTATGANTTSFPLTIQHSKGEITLEAPAQRVVALEWTYVENLLALGVQPVGVADIENYHKWVRIPAELDPNVRDVGTRQQPNLEQIASLAPDLILVPAFRADANYAELAAIAPTLAFNPYPVDRSMTQFDEMRQTFTTIAQAVGRESEGQAVLDRMDAQFATLAEQIAKVAAPQSPFVLAQAYSGSNGAEIRLFTENALAVQIVERLGLSNSWGEPDQPYGFSTVNIEALPQLGETHFFYVVQDSDNIFAAESVRPLWENMPFVQAGQAYALGGDTWLFGGPLSAELLAETIAQRLLTESNQ